MIKSALLWLCGSLVLAQADLGEIRVKVVDPAGLPVPGNVEIVSLANQVRRSMETDRDGNATGKRLPFGLYTIRVERSGFATASQASTAF